MRIKVSKQPPPAGHPGTGSFPSTIAPPDHPHLIRVYTVNTKLNDFIFFFRDKFKFLLKELQLIKSLNLWWSMADIAVLHQTFNDFILSAMLLHPAIDLLPYQLRNYQMFYKAPWQNVVQWTSLWPSLWHQCDGIVSMMIYLWRHLYWSVVDSVCHAPLIFQ